MDMQKNRNILLLFLFLMVLSIPDVFACFGDKIGIAHLKGSESELSAQLIAIYIKEKTGIDSVVNEFNDVSAADGSLKKDETDIIIMTGTSDELDNDTLLSNNTDSKFFTLIESDGEKVVLRVAKKRLEDIKFYTLNKVMGRIHKVISGADFKTQIDLVKAGTKFPKEAAREYLTENDLI